VEWFKVKALSSSTAKQKNTNFCGKVGVDNFLQGSLQGCLGEMWLLNSPNMRGMNDSGDYILDEGDILEADIRRDMRNKRPLTKITKCSW
jgi:hypothetical protein